MYSAYRALIVSFAHYERHSCEDLVAIRGLLRYIIKNRPGVTSTEAARNYTGRTDITHLEQVKLYHSPGKNTSYRAFLCPKRRMILWQLRKNKFLSMRQLIIWQ